MVISGNVRYIEMIFSHLSTTPNRDEYQRSLYSFKDQYIEKSSQKEYFLGEIKKSLFVLLNGSFEYELNEWFFDYAGFYLKDDHAVVELLETIWDNWYDEPWKIEEKCSYHLICAPIDTDHFYN